MELLQTLLSKPNLNVNAIDKEEQTALSRAMAKNNVVVVFALLKANAHICLLDKAGLVIETDILGSLLLHAASTNNPCDVEVLLRANVSPATINKNGATALHVAAVNGYDAIAALLLAKDPSLALHSDRSGNLPLHLAAANGHLTIVKLLLNNSTDSGLNCTNNAGEVPLCVAATAGHANVVAPLLEAKAKTITTTSDGSTLLHAAAFGGSAIVFGNLRSHFSTMDVCDERGQTPLHIAAKQGQYAAVQFLLCANANVVATSSDEMTPRMLATEPTTQVSLLHEAASRGHTTILTLLLTCASAAVDALNKEGDTALSVAVGANHVAGAEALLRAGANVHAAQSCSTPLLQRAIAFFPNDVAMLHVLLTARGLRLNEADLQGYTALASAVVQEHTLAVHALLLCGADATIPCPDGYSVLATAIRRFHRDLAKTLYTYVYPPAIAAAADDLVLPDSPVAPGSTTHVTIALYKHQSVAIKGPRSATPRVQTLLRAEIDAMQTATSPYVLPLLAVLDTKTAHMRQPVAIAGAKQLYCPTLILESMDGGDLAGYHDRVRDDVESTIAIVHPLTIAWVVANALLDLHAKNVVHRDVKSRNIFLSKRHLVRLGDLGSARMLDDFMTGNVGTTFWMAPEVIRVLGAADEDCAYTTAADIYSFGVVLTELYNRTEPYADVQDRRSIAERVRTGQLRPRMSANCPDWLRTLADTCLNLDPTARPTAAAIVDVLYTHRDEAGMSATTTTTTETPTTTDSEAKSSGRHLVEHDTQLESICKDSSTNDSEAP